MAAGGLQPVGVAESRPLNRALSPRVHAGRMAAGATCCLLFNKPSPRTRVCFNVAGGVEGGAESPRLQMTFLEFSAGASRAAAGSRHCYAPRVRARWRRWAGMGCACCRCHGRNGSPSRRLWAARAPGCAAGCPCSPVSASPAPTWAASMSGRASCPGAGAARAAGTRASARRGCGRSLGEPRAGPLCQEAAVGPLNFRPPP